MFVSTFIISYMTNTGDLPDKHPVSYITNFNCKRHQESGIQLYSGAVNEIIEGTFDYAHADPTKPGLVISIHQQKD